MQHPVFNPGEGQSTLTSYCSQEEPRHQPLASCPFQYPLRFTNLNCQRNLEDQKQSEVVSDLNYYRTRNTWISLAWDSRTKPGSATFVGRPRRRVASPFSRPKAARCVWGASWNHRPKPPKRARRADAPKSANKAAEQTPAAYTIGTCTHENVRVGLCVKDCCNTAEDMFVFFFFPGFTCLDAVTSCFKLSRSFSEAVSV